MPTHIAPIAPQLVRRYDENCKGYYYVDRAGKWMWDPNCIYKGTGPISGLGHATINHDRAFGETVVDDDDAWYQSPGWRVFYSLLSITGAATGAYHGYKRNNGSVGWAIGWSIFGGLLPMLSIPIELAEGFGKPKKAS